MKNKRPMRVVSLRLPDRLIEHFEKESKKTTIPKTTLMRSYLSEKVKEKQQ